MRMFHFRKPLHRLDDGQLGPTHHIRDPSTVATGLPLAALTISRATGPRHVLLTATLVEATTGRARLADEFTSTPAIATAAMP